MYKQINRPIVAVSIIALELVITFFVVKLSIVPREVEVAHGFIKTIQDGDSQKAYSLTGDEFKQYTSQSDLIDAMENNWALLPKGTPYYTDKEIVIDDRLIHQVIASWPAPEGGSYKMVIVIDKDNQNLPIIGANSYFQEP